MKEQIIALLTAGGIGARMGQEIPKQFMCIFDKPVIVYTMEQFQAHPEIDAIAVVCLAGWESFVTAYAHQYGISKLKWIFPGGATNHESISHGIFGLRDAGCNDDDMVLIHDGVRALVDKRIITDNIATCRKYGSAVTGKPCNEVALKIDGDHVLRLGIPREQIIRAQTPNTYRLKTLVDAYRQAQSRGLTAVAACDLIPQCGGTVQYLVQGSARNSLKLTMPEDTEIFRSLIELERTKGNK